MNPLKKITYGLLKKCKFLPTEFYLKIYYEYYTKKKLNLDRPVEFNEKIQWLKAYFQHDILTQLVDKYAVREYIKEIIGSEYLNEIIGVYHKFEEIPFHTLPEQFVIKGTHGCNFNLIVKDKSQLDMKMTKKKIQKWLGRNYYYKSGLEWAYKNVPPRIIIEKYLEEKNKENLSDYKFFCFNGKPKYIQVDHEISNIKTRAFLDTKWNKLELTKGKIQLHTETIEKPSNLEEMLVFSEKLSGSFPFVRVDFYSVNGKTVFGEMTFYPSDGRNDFQPEQYNKILGDLIKLPIEKKVSE